MLSLSHKNGELGEANQLQLNSSRNEEAEEEEEKEEEEVKEEEEEDLVAVSFIVK